MGIIHTAFHIAESEARLQKLERQYVRMVRNERKKGKLGNERQTSSTLGSSKKNRKAE